MNVAVGQRVRIEGHANYLWGMSGTVVRVSDQFPDCCELQLDAATGVGVPAMFPAGRPVVVYVNCLVIAEECRHCGEDMSLPQGNGCERHPD